ncbi:MAG: glucose-1-phosphate adenylyltransferase, partial [Erysipelotrichaceae bacterium]|nr:glucose-1-phosphate adenylyltransferase [Erysipelotrichaceae bacterium]
FGKDIIPAFLDAGLRLQAYRFEGYWKDVGTIDSLWEANMDLLEDDSKLNLFDPEWKIYTGDLLASPQLIGSKAVIDTAYITQGCTVKGEVKHSVLFTNSSVEEGARVVDSVIMNGARIGKNARLYRCLVADDVKVPEGVTLGSRNSKDILLVTRKLVSEVE